MNNKLDADLVDDVSSENKFVTAAEKTTWNAKANASEVYTKSQTDLAIETAIGALDVSSVGGSGKYISEISETDGKISPIVETMDTVPTNGSTKAVTSGGVQAPLAEVVDNGAKNLLNCSLTEIKSDSYNSGGAYQFTWNGNVCTTPRGVTFTINSDNSIDVVATSVTADVWFRLKHNFQYGIGSYVISGCPSGGSITTYYIESDNLNARDTGDSIVINRSSAYTDNIFLVVKSGTTFTGTFKPMICTKAAWDVSRQFEPYAKTNPELTAKEQQNENNISWGNNYGYKNLINVTRDSIKAANPTLIWTDYTVSNHGGLSFTVNPDLSITISGTTTSQSVEFNILRRLDGKTIFKEIGNYRIDGKVQSGKGMLAANRTVSGSGVRYGADEGATATFDVSQSDLSAPVGVWYGINEGVGVNVDMTIYPMICLSTMDRTYQPYAMSNVELTVENASQQSEINYAVNTGAKNLLDVQHPTTTTRTSYQPLANGGVELSCSNATWTSYTIADIPVEAGKEYIITFLLDESSGTSNFYFFLRDSNSSGTNLATKNYGSTTGKYEASFTPSNSVIWLGIYLNNSATAATAAAKLRCMIRPASITDSTYEPYALPNPILTPAAIKAVDEGAKNLLTIDKVGASGSYGTSFLTNGVRFTVNTDGTITVNRESSSSSNATVGLALGVSSVDVKSLCDGTHVLSGCPSGGSSSTYRLYAAKGNYVKYDTGSGVILDDTTETTVSLLITIYSGYSASNLVFKPMICKAADWAISKKFVPYALSNAELTAKEQANENNISKLTLDGNTKTGDLNDISINEFAVYSSSSTHLPIPGYCFVRTSINSQSPSTSRLQEAFVMSTGASYVRTMSSGNWNNWLMITPNQ